MQSALPTVLVSILLSLPALAQSAAQGDWSGGDGVPGPVPTWADSFDSSAGVAWGVAPGRLVLGAEAVPSPGMRRIAPKNRPFAIHASWWHWRRPCGRCSAKLHTTSTGIQCSWPLLWGWRSCWTSSS